VILAAGTHFFSEKQHIVQANASEPASHPAGHLQAVPADFPVQFLF